MKLYRYRPATELVFKELRYSELYLASRDELNDPLDLNAQLNFFQRTSDETRALAGFLQREAFVAHSGAHGIEIGARMLKLMTTERLAPFLTHSRVSHQADIMAKSDLFDAVREFYRECRKDNGLAEIDTEELILALDGLFSQFLNNSAAVCFSERPNDFLMWSHYAVTLASASSLRSKSRNKIWISPSYLYWVTDRSAETVFPGSKMSGG